MSWYTCLLGEVITLKRGHDLPDSMRKDGDVPIVSSSGITGHHSEYKAKAPGVVTGRYGTIGEVFFVDNDYWPLNTALYVVDFKGNDPRFIAYFLQNVLKDYQSDKAAVPGVDRNVLHRLSVRMTGTALQIKFAGILASYDELIANNRRRIGLLEDAARQLYREWFIRYRFPGYEHTQMEMNKPGGWSCSTLDELGTIGRGASPRPIAKYMGGDIPWFRIADATASGSAFILKTQEQVTDDGAQKSIMLDPGALILSNSATCGIPYFAGIQGCIHDGWLHFAQFRRISKEFLYCFLYEKREELVNSVGDGSTQKNLNTAAVGRLKVILPPTNTLVESFNDIVQPMFTSVLNLALQNEKLATARDLLLPRLMSGEIAV